jgi:hypothetical protein
MIERKFQDCWRIARIIALTAAGVLALAYAIEARSHVVDIEIRSPEWDMLEHEANNKEDRKSYERVNAGEGSDRDYERADNYINNNFE